jgi:hypothetical protein
MKKVPVSVPPRDRIELIVFISVLNVAASLPDEVG